MFDVQAMRQPPGDLPESVLASTAGHYARGATGGLFFLGVTTRRREVGIGYGWLLRGVYLLMAVGGVFAGRIGHPVPLRTYAAGFTAIAAAYALGVSVVRRKAGVRGEHERA